MKKILSFLILIFILASFGLTGDWDILNQGIHGNINTIDFVNASTAWAVGYNRTLLRTEDGGETWIDMSFEDNKELYMVDFVNEFVGWAYGWKPDSGKSIIIKTEDGGLSWDTKYDTTDYSISTIYAVNEEVLFAIGYHGLMLKTSDGGDSWENISPYGEHVNLRSIWFINDSIGLIIGTNHDGENYSAMILRTFNGGAKWEERLDSEFQDVFNLQFVNDSTGFFVARDYEGEILFCRTLDTLKTWTVQSKTSSQINTYYALSSDSIFAIITDYFLMTNNGKLKLSIDSGKNWMQMMSMGSWMVNEMVFMQNLGFISGSLGFGMIGEWGMGNLLLRTADRGQNWNISILSYPFSEVYFIDKNKGFAGGGSSGLHSISGDLYRTFDGGETWFLNYTPGSPIKTCQFINDNIGYMLCEGQWAGCHIFKTLNGGIDWDTVFTENRITRDNFFNGNDMVFFDENKGFVVGGYWDGSMINAAILDTDNGGDNWEIVWTYSGIDTINYRLNSVSFPTENCGYAVGTNGIIVKYTKESGWKLLESPTEMILDEVFFIDELTGWACGGYFYSGYNNLVYLSTKDGGQNWHIQTDLPYSIQDMYFKNAETGIAVGMDTTYYGLIMVTKDGGEHWTKVVEKLPAPLRSIYFKDDFGWAVGDMGLVLKTEDGITWVDREGNNVNNINFQLYQNYPNPFNPNTIIKYTIGANDYLPVQNVDLSIYNILGQKVTTLVNKKQPAGNYSLEWNASGFASGVYLYQLKTDDQIKTKKMILIK